MSIFIQQGPFALFAAFVVAHALADFPLQGSYLALKKVRSQADSYSEYIIALSAHSVIHAGAVWLVSGSLLLGMIELVLHRTIDAAKGNGKFGIVTDQMLHLVCKLGYVAVLVIYGPV